MREARRSARQGQAGSVDGFEFDRDAKHSRLLLVELSFGELQDDLHKIRLPRYQ